MSSIPKAHPAENAGKPWSPEDEETLCKMYDSRCTIKEMCNRFGRTKGSITARLVHLGKIATCIYLGAAIEEKNRLKIIKIAQEQSIPVKQMKVDRGAYSLHAEDVDISGFIFKKSKSSK